MIAATPTQGGVAHGRSQGEVECACWSAYPMYIPVSVEHEWPAVAARSSVPPGHIEVQRGGGGTLGEAGGAEGSGEGGGWGGDGGGRTSGGGVAGSGF